MPCAVCLVFRTVHGAHSVHGSSLRSPVRAAPCGSGSPADPVSTRALRFVTRKVGAHERIIDTFAKQPGRQADRGGNADAGTLGEPVFQLGDHHPQIVCPLGDGRIGNPAGDDQKFLAAKPECKVLTLTLQSGSPVANRIRGGNQDFIASGMQPKSLML